jgi:hypothetical protein
MNANIPANAYAHSHSLTPDANPTLDGCGPRILPVTITGVSSTAPQTFDLRRELEGGQIRNIQAVFIDNSANTSDLVITCTDVPGLKLVARASKQAMLPIFWANLASLTLTTTNAAAQAIPLFFLNTPQPYAQW